MALFNYYTYAYLREDRTPYYIGKGKGGRLYEKAKGEVRKPTDKSRIIFLKQNLTEEEAFKHEKYMIAVFGRKDLGTGILRNRTDGGDGTSGRVISEKEREIHRKIGKSTYERRVGIHSRSKEQMTESGRRGGKKAAQKNKENCTAIFGMTLEEKIKAGRKGGEISYEKGLGFHAQTKEQRIKNCKKGGKQSSLQKWQCTVTGYISTSGPLTCYQKKRGIDPSNRIKLDQPRSWEITFECGEIVIVSCLITWAKENGYNYNNLISVRRGRSSNYKGIVRVTSL